MLHILNMVSQIFHSLSSVHSPLVFHLSSKLFIGGIVFFPPSLSFQSLHSFPLPETPSSFLILTCLAKSFLQSNLNLKSFLRENVLRPMLMFFSSVFSRSSVLCQLEVSITIYLSELSSRPTE